MRTLTLGSLFDGIGGFPLAAQRCGIKTVWASEIEPNCVEITKRHFPRMTHLGDITQIDGGKIPPVDIISFGSPCQDLSTAGKQKGLSGERSRLFLDAVRIIYEMRRATNGRYPTFIIWENVSGAFNSNEGRDFKTVLEKITNTNIPMPCSGKWATAGMVRGQRGGANVAWRLLDSQFWGVPQRRKRIFLVGDFRAERAPEILFKPESELGYIETRRTPRERIAAAVVSDFEIAGGCKENSCIADFGRTADRIYYNADKSRTLTGSTGGGGSATGNYLFCETAGFLDRAPAEAYSIGYEKEKAPCLRSSMTPSLFDVRPINLQVATRHKALGERTGLGIGENGAPANTLQENHCHGVFAVAFDETQITSATNKSNLKINAPCHTLHSEAGRTVALQINTAYPIRDPDLNKKANGFIVGAENAPASTLSATDRHAVAACFALENSSENDIAATLDASYYKGTGARNGKEREFIGVAMYENNSRGGYKEGCGTLRASGGDCGGGSENLIVIFNKIAYIARYILRRLTPLECERLQGFPDYWTKYGKSGAKLNDTPRYRALGNSLTVPCAERVFRGILAVLHDTTPQVNNKGVK